MQDPRVASRTAAAALIGYSNDVNRRSYGVDLDVKTWAVDAAAYAREAGDTARPAGASEAQIWREDNNVVLLAPDFVGELVWEVARLAIPSRSLGVLEQVGTYLAIEAPGVSFRTQPNTDPFTEQPFVDNDTNSLSVRWRLVAPRSPRPRVAGVVPWSIPAGPSVADLDVVWSDFRYSWGARYSTDLRALVPGGARDVRLYALVSITGGRNWAVRLGGRLAGFSQAGGSRKAALAAALRD